MLDVVLSLNGGPNIVKVLKIDQALEAMSPCKSVNTSLAVLIYAANKVVSHADVKDAVRFIGQKINVATAHMLMLQDVDGRDKPGHDAHK